MGPADPGLVCCRLLPPMPGRGGSGGGGWGAGGRGDERNDERVPRGTTSPCPLLSVPLYGWDCAVVTRDQLLAAVLARAWGQACAHIASDAPAGDCSFVHTTTAVGTASCGLLALTFVRCGGRRRNARRHPTACFSPASSRSGVPKSRSIGAHRGSCSVSTAWVLSTSRRQGSACAKAPLRRRLC